MSTSLPPPVNSMNKNSSCNTSSIASSNSTYFINLYKKSKILTIIFTSFVLLILLNLINGNNGDGSHSYNSINNELLHKQFSPFREPSECDNPFSMLGKLQVDLNVKEENVWVPFNKKCQPPRLMASLSNELGVQSPTNWSPLTSSTTLNKNFEDISFTFNKTVLVVGDSIARESVKYFCQLLNQDVVNLNDDHPWSPFRNNENENEYIHRKRAPRESSLPNICYIPQIDLMIIQMFHFGLDEEEFFKEKEQYNPPGSIEDRFKVHGRDLYNLIHNDQNPPVAFEGSTPRSKSYPDLIEMSSALWDLARFAKIDINNNQSTLTDLSDDRLDFYTNRINNVLHLAHHEFPSSQLVWRTSHYPSDCNSQTPDNVIRNWARFESYNEHTHTPFFHSNRLFQLDQAARYVASQPPNNDLVRINEWGHLMFGQHAHQFDQLHPTMLPGGWLWGDTMLYELRKAVEKQNNFISSYVNEYQD